MDQSQYLLTKKKAEALHYTQPFTLESTAIVDRLITDIMRVTEKYQQTKKSLEDSANQLTKHKMSEQPVITENERLTKENNQLHHEIIKIKEECSARDSQYRTALNSIDGERTDLKFVIELKDNKIRELEKEFITLKEKHNQVLSKIYCPSQNELNKRPKGMPMESTNLVLQSQKFFISKPIEGQELPTIPKESVQWAEELKRSDERVQKYRKEIEDLNKKLRSLEGEKEEFGAKMDNRENEIKRLQELYSPVQNMEKMTMKYISTTNDTTLNKFNAQNEFLNKENHRLEEELKKIKLSSQAAKNAITDTDSLRETISNLQRQNNTLKASLKELESKMQMLQSESGNLLHDIETRKFISVEELQRETQRANAFQEQIESIKKENEQFKATINNTNKLQSAYNSNKNAMKEAFKNIKEDKDQYVRKIEELTNESNSLKSELILQRDLLNTEKGKALGLHKDVELTQNSLMRIRNEVTEKTDEIVNLRKKITSLETSLLQLNNDKNDLKEELGKASRMKKVLEEKCDSFKAETLKNNVGATNEQISRMEALYNGAKNEIEHYKKEINELEGLLDQNKKEVKEADLKAQGYYSEMQALQENVRMLQNENKVLSNDISTKFEENRKLSTQKFGLEKDIEGLKMYKTQITQFETKATKQAESNQQIENENSGLKIRLIEFTKANEAMKAEIQAHSEREMKLEDRNNKLITELKQFEMSSNEIQLKIKRMIELEKTSNAYKEALDSEKSKILGLQKQLTDCLTKIKAQEYEAEKLTQNVETLKKQNNMLDEELALKAEAYIKLEQQVSEKQGVNMMSTHQLSQAEVAIVDVKNKLHECQKEKTRLEEDLKNAQKNYDIEKQKVTMQADQITRMKNLLNSMEKVKEELIEKLRQTTMGKKDIDGEIAKLQTQLAAMAQTIKSKDTMIDSLKESIKKYDANIDELHNQMDSKAEEIASLQAKLDEDAKLIDEFKTKNISISSKEDSSAKQLADRERELIQLQSNFSAVEKALNSTKEELYIKTKQSEKQAEDIEALTRAHQDLAAELTQIKESNEKLAKFGEESLVKGKECQEALCLTKKDKEDLETNIKNLAKENSRFAESMKALLADNKNLFAKIQFAEQEMDSMRKHIGMITEESKDKDTAIRSYQQQVTSISQQLEKAHNAIQILERNKGQLENDVENTKSLSYTFEATKEEFSKTVAKMDREKLDKDNEIDSLRKKCDMLKEQIDSISIKCNDLELVLSKERTTQHEQYLKIQKLESEKLDITNELSKKKLEISSNIVT